MTDVLVIPKFDKRHANAELRKKDGEWFWVRIPTTMDSLSRQRLMQSSDGREAYCVYMHLAAIAAKDTPRGVLADERGPFTFEDIALKSAIPVEVIKKAVERLSHAEIGWVLYRESNGNENPTALVHSNSSSNSNSSSEKQKDLSEHFETFWQAYPKCDHKTGKGDCRRYWDRQNIDDIAEQVMAGLGRWKGSRQWCKNDGEFIPSPMKWLKRHDWEAEPKADAGKGRKANNAAWDALGAETHRKLLAEVQANDPDVLHRAGNTDTDRAMRKLAKQKGCYDPD